MNRAERRRTARQVARGEIGVYEPPKKGLVATELVDYEGKRYKSINEYLEAMETQVCSQVSEIASQMLYETEIYMGAANIITMILAMEMTVGNLKTVQKSYQKIVDNYNEASDKMDADGIRKTYERLHEQYGVFLDFDDCDINWVCDNGEEILKRFRLKVGRDKP